MLGRGVRLCGKIRANAIVVGVGVNVFYFLVAYLSFLGMFSQAWETFLAEIPGPGSQAFFDLVRARLIKQRREQCRRFSEQTT